MPKSPKAKNQKTQNVSRRQDLAAVRREIVNLSGEQALARILEYPLPATLVQSFDEVDFHLLIHEIGLADALPLVAMASNRQLQYLLDIEPWSEDRLHNGALTRGLALMVQADAGRMVPYLARSQVPLVEYFLWRNVQLIVREHDQDPSDLGDDCFTLDNVFYLRILPDPDFDEAPGDVLADREKFIHDLIDLLADHDFEYFRNLLIESSALLSAEHEEEALRQRTVRLAEKGFLPFEEAVGVYQPLSVEQFRERGAKHFDGQDDDGGSMPVPRYAAGGLPNQGVFADALAVLAARGDLERIEAEFAGLCNQIAVADRQMVNQRAVIEAIARKTAGYLGIALEVLAADAQNGATLIQRHVLGDIFRVGYGQALTLKWQTDRWQRQSWYRRQGLKLTFWDQDWMGVLGGLLIKRPLFFDNYRSGFLYREFANLAEVHQTGRALKNIITVDALIDRIEPSGVRLAGIAGLTWKNFLLTAWVRDRIGATDDRLSIDLDALRPFFAGLWTKKGKIRITHRRAFLDWLAARSRQPAEAVSESLAAALEALFKELESEYASVAPQRLDRRYVRLFLIE